MRAIMAERVGFEPTDPVLTGHSLSRRALSTAQTPLSGQIRLTQGGEALAKCSGADFGPVGVYIRRAFEYRLGRSSVGRTPKTGEKMKKILFSVAALFIGLMTTTAPARAQKPSVAEDIQKHFDSINKKVLEMAKDFSEDKYDYRINPDTRTFGEVVLHVVAGNTFAAKISKGEKAEFQDLKLKDYPNKAAIVAALEKSIKDGDAALDAEGAEAFSKSSAPWVGIIEHAGEQYGTLAAYYRAAGMVPPA